MIAKTGCVADITCTEDMGFGMCAMQTERERANLHRRAVISIIFEYRYRDQTATIRVYSLSLFASIDADLMRAGFLCNICLLYTVLPLSFSMIEQKMTKREDEGQSMNIIENFLENKNPVFILFDHIKLTKFDIQIRNKNSNKCTIDGGKTLSENYRFTKLTFAHLLYSTMFPLGVLISLLNIFIRTRFTRCCHTPLDNSIAV